MDEKETKKKIRGRCHVGDHFAAVVFCRRRKSPKASSTVLCRSSWRLERVDDWLDGVISMAQSSDRVVIGKCVKAFSPNDGGYIHDETFEEVRCRVEDSDERLETRKDTPSSPSDGLTRFVSFSRSWLKTKEMSLFKIRPGADKTPAG